MACRSTPWAIAWLALATTFACEAPSTADPADPDACAASPCADIVPGADTPPGCTVDADCIGLPDWDHCAGPPVCAAGVCAPDTSQAVTCPTSPAPCVANVCRPETGQCRSQNKDDGTPCAVDGDGCTVEQCDGAGFCHVVDTTPDCLACTTTAGCDDQDACTEDLCTNGACDWEAVSCDDGDPCTDDTCTTSGGCGYAPLCAQGPCGPKAPTLSCGAPGTADQGAETAMAKYPCLDGIDLPAAEVVYPFIADATTTVRLSVDAIPAQLSHLLVLKTDCDAAQCLWSQPVANSGKSIEFDVKEGASYWFVVDAEVAGAVHVNDITLACQVPEVCGDLVDNDWDGLTDCQDGDCVMPGTPCQSEETSCADGLDNDADGDTDCEDATCNGIATCEWPETSCDDGVDNDGDNQVDCSDVDCGVAQNCKLGCMDQALPLTCGQQYNYMESWSSSLEAHGCSAGAYPSNDLIMSFKAPFTGAAKVTLQVYKDGAEAFLYEGDCASGVCVEAWPLIPGFDSAFGTMGTEFTFDMSTGQDYTLVVDAKNLFDWFDPWLTVDSLNIECSGPEVCDDGIDNDWNGATDCEDLPCLTSGPPCELGEATCEDGLDNDGDGQTDCLDIQCQLLGAPCESPESTCDDGLDNDGNGQTDCADLMCLLSEASCQEEESACEDGLDNDGDGKTDCEDPSCALINDCPQVCGTDVIALTCGMMLPWPISSEISVMPTAACADLATPGADIIFSLTPPFDSMLMFDAYGPTTGPHTIISLLAGACDMNDCIPTTGPGGVVIGPGWGEPGSLWDVPLEGGQTYYLVVDQTIEAPQFLDYVYVDCF